MNMEIKIIMTCKDCKWWENTPEIKPSLNHQNMGECENPLLEEIGNDCLSAGEVWGSPCTPATGPDFGCIHHEAK